MKHWDGEPEFCQLDSSTKRRGPRPRNLEGGEGGRTPVWKERVNIVDLMPRAFNLFLGPLAALFVCGLFVPRVTARAMLPAGLLAVGISVVWSYWRPLTGKGYDLSPNWAIWVPCVSGVTLATLFSLFDPTAGRHTGREWSWRAVMRTRAGSNKGPATTRVAG